MPDLLTLPEPDLMVARSPEAPTVYPYQRALDAAVRQALADILLKAPLASPTFTGDPKAPTPSASDNDTSIATTAFVTTAIANIPDDGMVFVNSATATSGTVAHVTNIPACKMLVVGYRNISHDNGANQTLRFALSTNNGSSYNTAQNMFSTAVAAAVSGSGILQIMRMDTSGAFPFQASFAGQILGGVETATSGTVNAIEFSWSAGNFDDASGAFYVYAMK